MVPSTKANWISPLGFGLVQKNVLCDQQKFVILTPFVIHDNLHKLTQLLLFRSLNSVVITKQAVFKMNKLDSLNTIVK